ncbi:DUF4190 domain-containing protein [Cellulomonas chitinilytica]|uniref:DUF4190 domain-containing protein n=1 Tax=Cellulomonas chitinilytica TaxID=398759 RepID=UPI0035713F86
MVTGVLLLGPVALVLGLVALRRTAAQQTRGRRLAIAGVVLGAVGTVALVVGVVVAVLTASAQRSLPPDVPEARDAHAAQLVTGNCLAALPADGTVETVRVVPCAEPHAAQVVTDYEFTSNAVWPGQDAADARVARACVLDDDEAAAGVRTVTWAPTEAGWSRGDRRGLCLAVLDDDVTGSLLDGSATLPTPSATPAP